MTQAQKAKIQIETCKALARKLTVGGCSIDNNKFAVSYNGVTTFILEKSDIVFNVEKVKLYDFTETVKENVNDTPIKKEKTVRLKNGKWLAQYKSTETDEIIYIDEDYIKPFGNCRLYAYSNNKRVIVKDCKLKTIGAILPVVIYDKNCIDFAV